MTQRGDFGRSPGAAGTGHDRYLGERCSVCGEAIGGAHGTPAMAHDCAFPGCAFGPGHSVDYHLVDGKRVPAVPVPHAEAGDELLDELVRIVVDWSWDPNLDPVTEAQTTQLRRLLAGPLADLLAKLAAVEALPRTWEDIADAYRKAAEGSYDAGARNAHRYLATDLRRALAGQHTTEEETDRG